MRCLLLIICCFLSATALGSTFEYGECRTDADCNNKGACLKTGGDKMRCHCNAAERFEGQYCDHDLNMDECNETMPCEPNQKCGYHYNFFVRPIRNHYECVCIGEKKADGTCAEVAPPSTTEAKTGEAAASSTTEAKTGEAAAAAPSTTEAKTGEAAAAAPSTTEAKTSGDKSKPTTETPTTKPTTKSPSQKSCKSDFDCMNFGICLFPDMHGIRRCSCWPGYTGALCEINQAGHECFDIGPNTCGLFGYCHFDSSALGESRYVCFCLTTLRHEKCPEKGELKFTAEIPVTFSGTLNACQTLKSDPKFALVAALFDCKVDSSPSIKFTYTQTIK